MNPTLFQDQRNQYDPSRDYLSELVGEQKKFKDNQALAFSKLESDDYIKTLQGKLDQVTADYLQVMEENKAKAKLEEMLDQHIAKSQQLSSSDTTPKAKEVQEPFDMNKIEELVTKKLVQREAETKSDANFKIVMDKLNDRFGHNYPNVVRERASFVGLSEEDVNSLARKSPDALFRMLGIDQKQEQFQSPPRSGQISNSFAPKGPEKRTWTYYQELRQKDPKAWLDPKTTVQMHKDYQELGRDFEDGDFKQFRDGLSAVL